MIILIPNGHITIQEVMIKYPNFKMDLYGNFICEIINDKE
jgi:hypothetical protein